MTEPEKTFSRIQLRNRKRILDAALEVFSQNGFRGSTLDQIASEAGLSKPNLIYYFSSKEDIHRTLLVDLLDIWLQPLRDIDATGEPREELLILRRPRPVRLGRDCRQRAALPDPAASGFRQAVFLKLVIVIGIGQRLEPLVGGLLRD